MKVKKKKSKRVLNIAFTFQFHCSIFTQQFSLFGMIVFAFFDFQFSIFALAFRFRFWLLAFGFLLFVRISGFLFFTLIYRSIKSTLEALPISNFTHQPQSHWRGEPPRADVQLCLSSNAGNRPKTFQQIWGSCEFIC